MLTKQPGWDTVTDKTVDGAEIENAISIREVNSCMRNHKNVTS